MLKEAGLVCLRPCRWPAELPEGSVNVPTYRRGFCVPRRPDSSTSPSQRRILPVVLPSEL